MDDFEGVIVGFLLVMCWLGFLSCVELVVRYEEWLGCSMFDLRWYMTFVLWKLVVFLEGFYKCWLVGMIEDVFFDWFEYGVLELVEWVWRTVRV